MASWLQNQIRAAEGLLEAVDRTAKQVSKKELEAAQRQIEGASSPRAQAGQGSSPARGQSPPLRLDDTIKAARPAATGTQPASQSSATDPPRQPASSAQAVGNPLPWQPTESLFAKGGLNGSKQPITDSANLQPPVMSGENKEDPPPLASLFGAPRQLSTTEPAQPQLAPESAAAGFPPRGQDSSDSPTMEALEQQDDMDTSSIQGQKTQPDSTVLGMEAASERVPGNGHTSKPPVSQREASLTTSSTGTESAKEADITSREQQRSDAAYSSNETATPCSAVLWAETQLPATTPNTADAVAEAIKAATAATGEAESSEDVDGPMDSRVREARLAKMVESMKRRLEQLKAENEQLEDLLRQADASISGRAGDIGRLEDELARSQAAESSAKAALIEAELTQQEQLVVTASTLERAKSRAAELQSRLAAVEVENEKLMQERELSEARILTALREEMAATEQRLEDERFAAAAARQSFAAREQELEQTLAESAATLASQQRTVEERSRRAAAAESRAAALEAEAGRLQAQVQVLQERVARQDPEASAASSSCEASQLLELQERAASLQAALSNSESQRQGMTTEVQHLRSEVESLRSQAAKAVHPADLEQQLREVTDLLYQKQSQLEKIAAERSAQQMAWERELATARDDAERVKRRVRTDRAATYVDGELVVPMDDMGATYQKLANNKRVGGAVKAGARFLDAGTLSAVRFLRQYPLGRLVVFAYVIFIHVFVWLLIHHLQQSALHVEHSGRLND